MKLLYFSPTNSIHTKKWIASFQDRGIDTFCLSLHPNDYNIDPALVVYKGKGNFFSRVLRLFVASIKLYKFSRKHEYDLIHVHSVSKYAFFSFLFPFNKPLVSTPWGSDLLINNNILKGFLQRIFFRRCTLITTDADHISRYLLQTGVPSRKIQRINFGIDTDFFSKSRHSTLNPIDHLISTTNIPLTLFNDDHLLIFSNRNLEPIYDLTTVIKSFLQLVDSSVHLKPYLLIAGTGSEEQVLRELTHKLNISEQVMFLGRVTQTQMISLLNVSDIFISSSKSDAGIAASIAEAMSMSLPVVVSDSGENNQWIKDDFNGWLYKTSDSTDLTRALMNAIENRECWSKIGYNARITILEKNSYKTEMNKMFTTYQKLLPVK